MKLALPHCVLALRIPLKALNRYWNDSEVSVLSLSVDVRDLAERFQVNELLRADTGLGDLKSDP